MDKGIALEDFNGMRLPRRPMMNVFEPFPLLLRIRTWSIAE